MKISLIAALTPNRVIGKDGKMPWHLSEDLKYFKKTTLNKPIIMGRKTFESLGQKPLPNRKNIVVTSDMFKFANIPGITIVNTLESALKACDADAEEVMIIGGAKIYEQFMPKADRLYLSLIHGEFEGDTYFPEYDAVKKWKKISEDEKEGFTAVVLESEG